MKNADRMLWNIAWMRWDSSTAQASAHDTLGSISARAGK
jgi:hypothetical protein